MSAEDALWEWDSRAAAAGTAPDDPEAPLTAAEADALLASLEAALADELRDEEAAALAEYEAAVAAEDAAAAAAALEHEEWGAPDASGDEPVPCPVCFTRRLLCRRGVVLCACGGVRLDLSAEGGSLPRVRDALAHAWAAHAATGCPHRPVFSQRSDFGAAALWAHCGACQALIAVL